MLEYSVKTLVEKIGIQEKVVGTENNSNGLNIEKQQGKKRTKEGRKCQTTAH